MANDIANQFKGLPIEELIVSPLVGMAKGQAKLNDVTWKYIQEVGFDTKDGKSIPRALDVEINRYVQVEGAAEPELQTLQSKVPLLPLIPLPSLAITQADIQFTMEVQQHDTHTDSTESEKSVDINASYKSWWGLKVESKLHGKVTNKSENTRKTDNTAKYDVKVHAEQLPASEGMLKLSDALITMIEPVVANPSK